MRKPLTLKDRCELLWIRRLQQLNCYEQLVRKLSERRSVSSVARWAIQLGIEGEASRWSFHTWRRYLGALEKRVSRIVVRQERVDVRPLEFQAVMEEVERQTDALIAMPEAIPMAAREVWQQVKKTVKQMDSESMLKHCYVIQLGRVQRMLDVEAESGVLMREGYKNIAVLKEIADSVRKHEIGEEWTRGKGGAMPYGGPYPASLLPPAEGEPSEIEKKMATFDAVDRNLIREATVRVVEMIEEGSGGRFKVSGLDAEFRRAAGKSEGGSEPTAVSDVGTGS
jgi:hypothetical protein